MTIQELFKAIQDHKGGRYLLRMGDSNIMSGTIEEVTLNESQMIIKLEGNELLETFTHTKLRGIEKIEHNKYKYIYSDGSYFIITLEGEEEYIKRTWKKRVENIEEVAPKDLDTCEVVIYGVKYTITKN